MPETGCNLPLMTKGSYTRRNSGELTRDAKRGRLDPGEASILAGMGKKLDAFLMSRGLTTHIDPRVCVPMDSVPKPAQSVRRAHDVGMVVTGRSSMIEFNGKRFVRREQDCSCRSLFVMTFRAIIDDGKRRGLVNPKVKDEDWMEQIGCGKE